MSLFDLSVDHIKHKFDKSINYINSKLNEHKPLPTDLHGDQIIHYTMTDLRVDHPWSEPDNDYIYSFTIKKEKITKHDIIENFPVKFTNLKFFFKIRNSEFNFIFIENPENIYFDFHQIFIKVFILPVDMIPVGAPVVVAAPPPDRETLIRQRVEGEQRKVREAREKLSSNFESENKIKNDKIKINSEISEMMDKWSLTPDGKLKDIRVLLSTMDSVMWPDSGWEPVQLSELMMSESSVKKIYRRAILLTHPDKQQTESVERQTRADRIFNAINESFKLNR
jgi:hypothetical protein